MVHEKTCSDILFVNILFTFKSFPNQKQSQYYAIDTNNLII